MATAKSPPPKTKVQPPEPKKWPIRLTGWGIAAGIFFFVLAALQNTIGNLLSDWLKELASKPDIQVRYLALDLRRQDLAAGPSFPLRDENLSKIFAGSTVYVQHNAVLTRAAYIAKSFLSTFTLGEQRHPSIEAYEALLTPAEKFTKAEVGFSNGEKIYAVNVLPSNRELLSRGILKSAPARQLARDNPDSGPFFYSQLRDIRAVCGAEQDAHGAFEEDVFAPTFILIALDVSNISSTPASQLSFDTRQYRESANLQLYSTLAPGPSDHVRKEPTPFPVGTLQRGEHILVPLSILAEKPTLWTGEANPSPPLTRHLLNGKDAGTADGVSSYRSSLPESEDAFYFFGPAVQVKSIHEGSRTTAVRELAISNFTYSTIDLAGVGSCPRMSFQRRTTSSWTPARHILVGAEGKAKERKEIYELDDFGGQLLLREDDAEVSFLSYVAVEVTEAGKKTVCRPRPSLVAARQYLSMHRGDEIRVDCPLPANGSAKLIVRGYFEK